MSRTWAIGFRSRCFCGSRIVRLRFDKARKLVLLSDGAEWMRSLAAWLPIPTLLILDLFHAKHRIWEVANSLHGAHTPKAREWAEIQSIASKRGTSTRSCTPSNSHGPSGLKPRSSSTSCLTISTGIATE